MADDLVERYSMSVSGPFDREPPGLEPDPDGDWVMYSDYAALRAQLDEARKENGRLTEAAIVGEYMWSPAELQEAIEASRRQAFEEAAQVAEDFESKSKLMSENSTGLDELSATQVITMTCMARSIAAAIRQRGESDG